MTGTDLASTPPDVGNKFTEDGAALAYPGNTVVSMIRPDSWEASLLAVCQRHLPTDHERPLFAVLPLSSLHMTVFELVCDQARDERLWTAYQPTNAPLAALDQFFIEALEGFVFPSDIEMSIVGVSTRSGVTLELSPATATQRRLLFDCRERLSDRTGIRFPNHHDYRFHVTLAYRLRPATPSEARVVANSLERASDMVGEQRNRPFSVPEPELRFFEDMTAFHTGCVRGDQ